MNDRPPTFYALLVGIDEYASTSVPTLGGCVNDVDAVEQLLRDRYGVPTENIQKLTNSQATHQAIKDAFHSHLTARADAWARAGKPDPVPAFLFHYSGHGSQALDESGTEPDGLDETIVPHDSRVGDVFDIKDWELGQLIDKLTEPFDDQNANVTIILDCCHSGSGTRDIKPNLVAVRSCEPDLRPQPSRRPTARPAPTRGVSPSGWMLGSKYVLLAGCRDREKAHEYAVPQGDQGTRRYGAMTHFVMQELKDMSPARPLTYRELHERVRYRVNSRYENQMPQCEGQKDRRIFGGLVPVRDVTLTVVDKRDGLIWVDGGVAHGLTEGSQLHVYPPGAVEVEVAGPPIAVLCVEEAGAVRSGCVVEEGAEDVPLFSRATIAYLDHDLQRRVVLDIPDQELRSEVAALLSGDRVAPFVKLVPADQPADLRVQLVGRDLELQDSTGRLLMAPFPSDKRYELPEDVIHLARYHNALSLINTAVHSELAGAVSVEIQGLAFDADNAPIPAPLEPNAEGEVEIDVGQRIVVKVTNHAQDDLYVAVFNFFHDWSVKQLYPTMEGAHEALRANGGTLYLGLSRRRREQLAPGLPSGVNEAREFLKVYATLEETDFEMLRMGALKTADEARGVARGGRRSALTALLEQAADGSGPRGLGAPPASVEDEWTTAELEFRITRALDDREIARPLRGGTSTRLPGYALELDAPPGFDGRVRVLTPRQSVRSAGGEGYALLPPPGMAAFGNLFEPVGVQPRGGRSAGPGGAAIEIEADDVARRAVTEETPLKLRLPVEMTAGGEAMLALAYDGSLFYPVGRLGTDADTLDVAWLPQSDPTPAEERAAAGLRAPNLGRTVKLYLYRLARWEDPRLGLHVVRFLPEGGVGQGQPELAPGERCYDVPGGQACYRDVRAGEFARGQRVALFVHGFTSETRWMVGGPLPWLEGNGIHYDRYLAFDYETFNTRIGENGQALANALRKAGFGPDDGVHLDVIAISMGTLVARSMVEQHGGDLFVDRCFLAGPPNQGTRLAEVKRLVPWIGTLLLNQLGPAPALIANWALRKVSNDAVSIEDVRPGSDLLRLLNASNAPARVPYYILAGRHDLPTTHKNLWDRLAKALLGAVDAGLDWLFGDQHDLVINVRSMTTVRNGTYPEALLRRRVLPCNHFGYFKSEEGRETLLRWLREA